MMEVKQKYQPGISYDEEMKRFHLKTTQTSYVMEVLEGGYLSHIYWGRRVDSYKGLATVRYRDRGFSPNPNKEDRTFSLDTTPQEYPSYGHTDFRAPAIHLKWNDGSTVSDFRYVSHRLVKGKPALEGLPATYVDQEEEAESLEIKLVDAQKQVAVYLLYTVFYSHDAITRSVRVVNEGDEACWIQKVASANIDFRHDDFDCVTLAGAHERERDVIREPLTRREVRVESRRGSSSHQQHPFMALVDKGATEDVGDVYASSFVYSGNFLAQAEVDQFRNTRMTLGINPFDFEWLLERRQSFQTPEAVLVYSSEGLGGMSRTFHGLFEQQLVRGTFKQKERPILINNWEATYFSFDEKKVLDIVEHASKTGVELFVLDDGWFGERNDDYRSLGDWTVNTEKLPNGLKGLAEAVKVKGMQFGLWVEPEMVSANSELYRLHPDWCIHVPNRRRSESRNQLVLDLSNKDVQDYLISTLTGVFSSADITYVKWDMNRNMTEIGSKTLSPERQRETAHRYILGLYRILENLTNTFPNILFESCSGGGGRFDPGMLYYMPQTWTSDNTDAISRTRIQYGTSLIYPTSTMGSHVSASPNHQVGRTTPLATRGHVAMEGNLGYELDVTKLSKQELREMSKQIEQYKQIRETVQYGDLYRLRNPFERRDGSYATLKVNKDKSEAVLLIVTVLAEANGYLEQLKLKGLKPEVRYYVDGLEESYTGEELMYIGIPIPYTKYDFQSTFWVLREVDR